MTRVLILTAGYGDGHNTAAFNLREAFEAAAPDARVEVVDLLRYSYGWVDAAARQAYHLLMNHAPHAWGGLFLALDRAARLPNAATPMARARRDLAELLRLTRPDCVISTYPAYTALVHSLDGGQGARPFQFGVVVTDSVTVNAAWHVGSVDFFCVPNEETAAVLRSEGIEPTRIHSFGFPVSPRFAEGFDSAGDWEPGQTLRVLYVLNHGTRKAVKTVRRLLRLPGLHLTVVAGRNQRLRAKVQLAVAGKSDRVEILGWTDSMPELMCRSHLVISKAGGATLQESLAAGKPVLLNQVVPGQEQGNAEWVLTAGLGAVADGPRAVARTIEHALEQHGLVYRQWCRAVARHRRPAAAAEFARFVLERCADTVPHTDAIPGWPRQRQRAATSSRARRTDSPRKALLCDFHVHSTWSDGMLTLAELVDLYGRQRFDVLCVTDHVADPGHWFGRWSTRLRLSMDPRRTAQYFEVLEQESRRAWDRHGLILLTGLEFNRPRIGLAGAQRLLAVGLQTPIDPGLPWHQVIEAVHEQGGLVFAPHPAGSWWSGTRSARPAGPPPDEGLSGIDAWEIRGLTSPLSAGPDRCLPLIASSNFHQPKHLQSWKTLLFCDKDPQQAIDCIRRNRHLGMAYFDGSGEFTRPSPPLDRALRSKRVPDLRRLSDPAIAVPAVQLTSAR